MLYSYVLLSKHDLGFLRFSGSGLGNILLPWARFVVETRKHRLIPIAPTWPTIRIGTILRKERDKRFYTNLFHSPDMISGIRKILLFWTAKRINEEDFYQLALNSDLNYSSARIVVFEGTKKGFSSIFKAHELLKNELLNITLDCHKRGLSWNTRNSISLHVRFGDFKLSQCTTPLTWFNNAIITLRKCLGQGLFINIFSDANEYELKPLLALRNVKTMSFGSSIADMLALSRSRVLVLSKHSTFGKWASYLGRMPIIRPKGEAFSLYYEKPQEEIQWDGQSCLPNAFINACRESIFA